METSTIITIETALIGAFSLLLGFFIYVIKEYAQHTRRWQNAHDENSEKWRKEHDERMNSLILSLNKDFVTKKDADALHTIARDHEKRLVTVETKQQIFEDTCNLCKSSSLGKV